MRGKHLWIALGIPGVWVASAALALCVGTVAIAPAEIAKAFAAGVGLPAWDAPPEWVHTIAVDLRLPRVLTASLAGAGLAVSGTALQAVFRNPLADPSVLGVASGAALGGVIAVYAGSVSATSWWVPAGAFVLALLTGGAVYAGSVRGGRVAPTTLLLVGVAASSLLSAAISLIVSLSLADYRISRQLLHWLLGGLDGRSFRHVSLACAPVLVGAAGILHRARDLDALLLGETHAASIGVDAHRTRRWVIVCTALATGGAVSVAGVVPFVGLVVPHALRLVLGPLHAALLPASLVGGAVLVVLADAAARQVIAPQELHLGVVTAALGAPVFMALLRRATRKEAP